MSAAKRAIAWFGALLSLGCVAWIIHRFIASGVLRAISDSPHAATLGEAMLLAIPVYAVAVGVLSLAWLTLQRALAVEYAPPGISIAGYLVSQFGKYLPGNVAQYAGRHMILRREGASHRSLVACALAEAALLLLAAILWARPLLPMLVSAPVVSWALPLVMLAVGACVAFGWLRRRVPLLARSVEAFHPTWLVAALAAYVVFFAVMAFTLWLLCRGLRVDAPGYAYLAAVAAASWMAGFVVPGAPAGLGVREAAFLALLGPSLPEADVLLLAAAMRVATFGGDGLACLAGLAGWAATKRTPPDSAAEP
ncbi:lysylphosphatidylglycerol synthase domain-containing protein [Pinirhizobacter soli]|uniref:lysylphosphatidylglycerol synthase domain-containing protein n=1 Tax=Pinirhizobacter soli TaxID=2786953 RepID=UPI00202A3CDB